MPAAHLYNETELLARIAEGDASAFTIIFNSYRSKVYSIAMMLTHDEDIGAEMVQEVFAKIWTMRARLTAITDFEAWLFIVVRNAAYKMLQKIAHNKEVVRRAGYRMPDFTNETDDTVLFNNYQQVLQEAVDKLPPQQRTAWILAKQEGLKRTEIAERMQIKPDTVKEYLALATKSIRAHCLSRLELSTWLAVIWLLHK